MKKPTIIMLVSVLLLIVVVIGSTYAFFASSVNGKDVQTSGSKFQVIYTGETQFDKQINLSTSKVEESSTTVNIKVGEGSVKANAVLYLVVEDITTELAVEGFNWEVYGYINSNQVYYNEGNFDGVKINDTINIVENYQLSEKNTEFKVYLWLDGNKVGNEVMNASFKGHIGAKTENFTGQLQ